MTTSKPVHPATVHFPLGLLLTAYGLDVLDSVYSAVPTAISTYLPSTLEIPRLSYYALSAGLLASIPAIMSGGSQAYKMIAKQGIYEADNKTIRPKVKMTISHALLNDAVVAISAYTWWCKRESSSLNYANEGWMVAASIVAGVLLTYSGHLGGTLTYNYGVGLNASKGKGKEQ